MVFALKLLYRLNKILIEACNEVLKVPIMVQSVHAQTLFVFIPGMRQ